MVESDLSQFYDRVRPNRLAAALRNYQNDNTESAFFDFAEHFLDWSWHPRDLKDVAAYAKRTDLSDFTRVALPQGLVAAGFLANALLIKLDDRLRGEVGGEVVPGIRLEDACRYVDDLRIVVAAEPNYDVENVAPRVGDWLAELLDEIEPELRLSKEKRRVAEFGGSERPLVRQSTRMARIQTAVSGGFDVVAGVEILDAVQGLMRSQEELNRASPASGWRFSPVPDVGDETVARFLAGRFRTTYRSIRPLLEGRTSTEATRQPRTGAHEDTARIRPHRSRENLDEDAQAFALTLIERWVKDPSNVRLLRIGLDIWPDAGVLKEVLGLLQPFTEKGAPRGVPRRVAWYCLAELLRAGATETGLVEDDESLPETIDFPQYRRVLCAEAVRLIGLPTATIPWYLRQQALLLLAVVAPIAAPVARAGQSAETRDYRRLILFLRGDTGSLSSVDFATLAILARRAYSGPDNVSGLVRWGLTADVRGEIAVRDPAFARELNEIVEDYFDGLSARIREDLCVEDSATSDDSPSLVEIVMGDPVRNSLRNELALLRFSVALLDRLQQQGAAQVTVITPGQIRLKMTVETNIAKVDTVDVREGSVAPDSSLYAPPSWCQPYDRWRFHLGFLLRFILSGQPDFTAMVRPPFFTERSGAYRPLTSHWYQRIYGLFSAQEAFGDDWLPITDWMERFLLAVLRWPGCRAVGGFDWVDDGIAKTKSELKTRIARLENKQGRVSKALLLPMNIAPRIDDGSRALLRACVVQTVVPTHVDASDLDFSKRGIRRKHRDHLSAALAAVQRMLDLRRTHYGGDGQLDWLILPELAVHPRDVRTHLIPFARKFRTLILTGLTYQDLFPGKPLVNSALWIIPEWSKAGGLQVRIRRQGKAHLAPDEQRHNLQGFRPCQWLMRYQWASDHPPVTLTAAVCYDATDLGLAADLRTESDVFAIPALNRDVKTFDQMALALHYHMFQLVVVVNNGMYGGSNAYWPSADAHRRQLFHLHGQPQASIGFFEIDDIPGFLERRRNNRRTVRKQRPAEWKYPPAGVETTP